MSRRLYRIAIQPDFVRLSPVWQESFSQRWIGQLEQMGHEVRIVDAFREDFFEQLHGCDGFLWWFPPKPFPRNYAKRLLMTLSHLSHLRVLPDWKMCWHFDDKVAQSYLLKAAHIPTPRSWVFWQARDAFEFCRQAQYPLVIKLSAGVYSRNVGLLRSRAEAEYRIRQLFGDGLTDLKPLPESLPERVTKRLAESLGLLARGCRQIAEGCELQKDCILLQEFVPDNEFDTRITVIGNRAFAFRRYNRPNDFRASGSAILDTDPSKIEADALRLAFRTREVLGIPTLCVDVLRRMGEPVLSEISYFYLGQTVRESVGHWVLRGDATTGEIERRDGRTWAEDAILEDFLAALETVPFQRTATTS